MFCSYILPKWQLRSRGFWILLLCTVSLLGLFLVGFIDSPAMFVADTPLVACGNVTPSECTALITFFNSMGGVGWSNNAGWPGGSAPTNTPCDNPGGWLGVTCDISKTHVVELRLRSLGLNGTLPDVFGEFSSLQVADFSYNTGIIGAIPPTLLKPTLETLYLKETKIDDVIPDEIVQMKALKHLLLGSPHLKGQIPVGLSNLNNLEELEIDSGSNKGLTGTLPAQLGELSKLSWLRIVNTQITGPIPPELGKLKNLTYLGLDNNQLTGGIPLSITNELTKLNYLILQGNQLDQPLPEDWSKLTALKWLYVSENHIPGKIPPNLGQLSQLEVLQLNTNRLEGSIPSEMFAPGNLPQLRLLWLHANQLSGEVPIAMSTVISQIKSTGQGGWLNLQENKLTATDPALRALLDATAPSWQLQTIAPTSVNLGKVQAASAELTWQPIPLAHAQSAGGYKIQCNTAGKPAVVASIAGKITNRAIIKGLHPGYTYVCAIHSYTLAQGRQQNLLESDSSLSVSATPTISLLSIYALALDSALGRNYTDTLTAIQNSTLQDTNKVAVVLGDQPGENNTELLFVYGGVVEKIAGLPDPASLNIKDLVWCSDSTINPGQVMLSTSLTEYNMANCAQLGAFLRWAVQTYPAPQRIFSYIGHGVPLAPAIDIARLVSDCTPPNLGIAAELRPGGLFLPPAPGGQDAHPGELTDATSCALISPYALAQALRIGTDNGQNQLTVLDIVHCFGGTLEEFHELSNPGGKPFAQMMIGSPNYTYGGDLVVRETLLAFTPGQSAQQVASTIVQGYNTALNLADKSNDNPAVVHHPRILTIVASAQIPLLTAKINVLYSNQFEKPSFL